MTQWLPIQYRGFWDVPRIFIVRFRGRLLLFACPFSEELDDYPDVYRVSLLPDMNDADLPTDWTLLEPKAIQRLGEIPVRDVVFDSTRRKSIAAVVESFLGRSALAAS